MAPEITSIHFNPDRPIFCATFQKFQPTIYDVSSPLPVKTFNAPRHGQGSFVNACTIKYARFGGPDNEYILCGSDDFRVYAWNINTPSDVNVHADDEKGFESNEHGENSETGPRKRLKRLDASAEECNPREESAVICKFTLL